MPMGQVKPVAGVTVSVVVVALALSGCSRPAPIPTVTMVVTQTPTPTPTPTPIPTAVTIVPPPPPAAIVPNPDLPQEPVEDSVPSDLGPGPGAQGVVTYDGNGVLLTYRVVEGDTFFDIAQRFDVPQQQLLRMNPQIEGVGLDISINELVNLNIYANF